MNVTLTGRIGQAAIVHPCRAAASIALAAVLPAMAATPLNAETHANFQAVTSTGASAWNGSFPITLRGVLLCHPEEMLDFTPRFLPWNNGANQSQLGAEWQIVFQAADPEDRGGTTCWMGQSYGNMPWLHDSELSYSDAAWGTEILRLNHDPATLRPFRAGDLIEITARQGLFYGGKRNINEAHDIDPANNFDISLVVTNYGLPTPEVITLADVMEPGGSPDDWKTWPARFDATRATGAEHYQGMRVRINNLTLVTTGGWNPANAWGARLCTVTDGAGRYFRLRHPRYSLGDAPTTAFDAIGVFTQESGGSQGTNGYELFAQQVLPHTPAPQLAIGASVVITWPGAAGAYGLEWRSQADAGEWSPVTNAPAVIDGLNTVILAPTSPQRFYRLQKTE